MRYYHQMKKTRVRTLVKDQMTICLFRTSAFGLHNIVDHFCYIYEILQVTEPLSTAKSFSELGLSSWLIQQLNAMRVLKPTAVQANCIPQVLQGRDVLGCAKTGTGKTLAFVLPILHEVKIQIFVLDEADQMLDGQYSEQLKTTFLAIPKKRRTLLFSATITSALTKLHQVSVKKPYFFEDKQEIATVEHLEQRFVLCPVAVKDAYLVRAHSKVLVDPRMYVLAGLCCEELL
ncbi:DEAD/DEAH box helicase [Ancylostoma duodenale]|uniref:RNA helicase n=1 Tax=Ancylostoma duodenale TaxID=51022 RepID=A0A0C2GQ58_9BILA|nr:DEAD/DEAH box helicase [Ancylostoma duodenale]